MLDRLPSLYGPSTAPVTGAAGGALSVAVDVMACLLAGYLTVGMPVISVLQAREFATRLERDSDFRPSLYRRTCVRQWRMAGLVLALIAVAGAPMTALGLPVSTIAASAGTPRVGACCAALSILALILGQLLVHRRGGDPRVRALLPQNARERRAFFGAVTTAGVVEELLFRGFLLLFLTHSLQLSVAAAAVVSSCAFGAGHLYQGAGVALLTTAAGLALTALYFETGSLLPPIAAHLAINLSALPLLRARRRGQKWSWARADSRRSPLWKTFGAVVRVPSPVTSSRVGAVEDAW